MAVTPITIQLPIPVWMPMVINHTPVVEVETEADIPGGSTLTQYVEAQSTTDIEITINGGELPASDEAILVISNIGGVILPGVGDGQWQADRVSEPNQIILNTEPVTPFDLSITISV